MEATRKQKLLLSLRKTRSHLINALDGTNEHSNVIQIIDNLVDYLKLNSLDNIDDQKVTNKLSIIRGEINCSLNCFNNALKVLNN